MIEAIGGHQIAAGENWYPLLNRKAGDLLRLSLSDPETGKKWQETVKPISQGAENELLYQRWVRSRRAEVDRLSGGRLGYAHIRTMSDNRYREIFEDIFGKAVEKEGIVLDTRFNNGGNLVEALTILLTGETYARAVPRGQFVGTEPHPPLDQALDRGHERGQLLRRPLLPGRLHLTRDRQNGRHAGARHVHLGVVGDPCRIVRMTFGIPMVGYLDNEGDLMENKHLDPDIVVDNDPALEAIGQDQQLEAAVEALLAEIDG